MKRYLLDSSFVIDLLNEISARRIGSALSWLKENGSAQLWISPVTMAEVLEGAEDADGIRVYLGRYRWQGIYRVHSETAARVQRRSPHRMGENDAWQAAIAESMDAIIVADDDKAFLRLGERYDNYRQSKSRVQ